MGCIHDEDYSQALLFLRRVARQPDRRLFAFCATGACFYKLKRFRAAERWLRRALAIDPQHRSSRLNLANTLLDLEELEPALELYLELLEADPHNLRFQINTCHALAALKRTAEAQELLQRIRSAHGQDRAVLLELGRLLACSSVNAAVMELLRDLIRLQPDCDEAYFLMGQCLRRAHRNDDAVKFLKRACELKPGHGPYLTFLADVHGDLSQTEAALEVYGELLDADPSSPMLQLTYHLITPIIPRSCQEQHFYWSRVMGGLRILSQKPWNCVITPYLIYPHLFFLAYHRQNLRLPLRVYGDLLFRLYGLTPADTTLPQRKPDTAVAGSILSLPQSSQQVGRPIRIGFASEHFTDHSNIRAFEGLIHYLDKQAFELILIHGPSSAEDDAQRQLNSEASRVIKLQNGPNGFPDHRPIEALELDILFYPDLGMNCQMNYLAMRRLAPIQMTSWGLPHTSGIRSIDYYLSSELAEPADGDDHYVETLVRLPGLPCCYRAERLKLYEVPRDYFVLPPGVPVFGCLQSLYKLHPDFDLALEQLALANPDAAFIFVENSKAGITQRFIERVKISAPHFHDQLVMMALMNRLQFMALSKCIDVLLDPFYYCSGITFYESTFVGTPTVTMEGAFLRSRFVAAAYRLIGLDNPPVAHSPEEYVAIASRLIQQRDELAQLRDELQRKAEAHLYDDLQMVRGFEDFCQQAVVRHGLRPAAFRSAAST